MLNRSKRFSQRALEAREYTKLQWGITSHWSDWPSSKSPQTLKAGERMEKKEPFHTVETSLVAQTVKHLSTMRETRVRSLGGKISWRRKWQPTPVFLPEKSHGGRNLVGYRPWGHKELDTTEQLHFAFPHSWWECKLVEQPWRFLKKLKTSDLAIHFWTHIRKTQKLLIQKDTCTPMFIAALFTVAKMWK